MRAAGLFAKRAKQFKVTTDSRYNYPTAANLLNRDFSVDQPRKVWVSDIIYIRTKQGWLYLCIVMDLFDRKTVGWSTSNNLNAKLIFHSDRGVQYTCTAFTNVLKSQDHKVSQSMSRKGNCWDNAVAESFFKSIKTELIYKNRYSHRTAADLDVFQWIEGWYNRKRRHSALGMLKI